MISHLSYSTSILDTLGVLSSFSVAESIWSRYEKYAIPKIEEATLKIRGSMFYVKHLTPKQAQKELEGIEQIVSILSSFRLMLDTIEDPEFARFKDAAIEFLDTIDDLRADIQDVANIHSSYQDSIPVLKVDWGSEEDEHWDNY